MRSRVYADELHGAYSMLHLALDDERPETVAQTMVHVRSDRDADCSDWHAVAF